MDGHSEEVVFHGPANEFKFLLPGKVLPDTLKSPEVLKASCTVHVYYK